MILKKRYATGAAAHHVDEALGCPAQVERTGAAAHRVHEALGCPAQVDRAVRPSEFTWLIISVREQKRWFEKER